MRVLITGVAGFIGSHLAERLLREGHDVFGVDNFSSGRVENFEFLRDSFPNTFRSTNGPFDVAHPTFDGLSTLYTWANTSVDGIFHLASPASPPDYLRLPFETIAANVDGSRFLCELAHKWKCRILYTSTSEVYGDPHVHPQPESYWGNVNPIGPRSVYDEAKRMGETILSAYHRQYGIDIRIVRLFNTYGPRMRLTDGRIITNFITQGLTGAPLTIYGDGTQTRSLCYVSDTVEGIVRAFQSDIVTPINIGNPDEYTINDLATLILGLTRHDSVGMVVNCPLPTDDPRQRKPDITKAITELGWSPIISIHTGLQSMIEYVIRELSKTHRTGKKDPSEYHTPINLS